VQFKIKGCEIVGNPVSIYDVYNVIGDLVQSNLRIEQKLDHLIRALSEEDEEAPQMALDGSIVPGERDQNQEL